MKFLLPILISFFFTSQPKAQSKYLDTLRTTPTLIGGLGISENSVSKLVGLNLSIKGSIDIGLQIGSVKIEDDPEANPFTFDRTGTAISSQAHIFFANQRRGNPVNLAVIFGGSTAYYDDKEINNFGAGLHLSYREMEPYKVWATPTFEILCFLINEYKDLESGRSFVGDPIISASFSLGVSTRMSDNNIFIFEPSLIYIDESQNINFGVSIGIIF